METRLKLHRTNFILLSFLLAFSFISRAQFCDSITPSFTVDLSASPNLSWVSPVIARDGNCCGTSAPDKCLEFIITLHPDVIAVSFNIASGAVPPGALFYQVDCGPAIAVGQPICLTGAGPHHLTFCKPGNNSNTFSIITYSEPIIGPDITLNAGCTDMIFAQYYNEASMTWTSVFPGAAGTYNSFLDCTAGCDSVLVTAPLNPPAYIDYLVCGTDIAGCNPFPYCDTIRVSFLNPVTVSVTPSSQHLCFGSGTTTLTATAAGGSGLYNYLWNTLETTSSISVGAGTYFCNVTDASGCVIVSDTAVVTQDVLPITANAGPDQILCNQGALSINLSGSIQTATGGVWSGGTGTFSPSNADLNAVYTPTLAEVNSGSITLNLTSTGNNGCPGDNDQVLISFISFNEVIALNVTNVSCNSLNDGQALISVNGIYSPCNYSWDNDPVTTDTFALNLAAGLHNVMIINSLGCDTTISFTITQPPVLNISLNNHQDNLCFDGHIGTATTTTVGGTPNYTYSWNTAPIQTTPNAVGLSAGNYSCTVTDFTGCTDNVLVTIIEPALLTLVLSGVEPNCFGSSNGSIASNVNGGVGPYEYTWSNNESSSNLYDLASGIYSLIVEDDNGCLAFDTLLLNQPTQIIGQISSSAIICPDASTVLGVQANGGTGNYQYDWLPNGETTDTITVSPSNNTFYNCEITDNNGCSILLTTSVSINTLNPTDLQASISDLSICQTDSVGLSALYIGSDASVVLNWEHCPTCPTNTTIYETPGSSMFYVLVATNSCGDFISDTVFVTVNQLPLVSLAPNSGIICPQESITFSNLGDNNPNWTYFWNFGDGDDSGSMNPTHSYSSPGNYPILLVVIDDNGCSSNSSDISMVTVNPQANAVFGVSSHVETTLDPTFEFDNFSSNSIFYHWNFGDGSTSNNINPTHTYHEHGFYTILLTANNQFNCPDSTYISVEVKPSFDIFVPNTFTPNNDNHNEFFFAKGYGISEKDYNLYIFNRWGDLMFESHDMNIGWDGTCKSDGTKAQDDVYTWVIIFRDLTEIRHRKEGHVSILK